MQSFNMYQLRTHEALIPSKNVYNDIVSFLHHLKSGNDLTPLLPQASTFSELKSPQRSLQTYIFRGL